MQLAFWAASLAVGILAGIVAGPLQAWVFAGLTLTAFVALVGLRARNLGLSCLAMTCGIWLGHREVARAWAPAEFVEDKLVEIIGQVVAGADVADQPAASGIENSPGQEGDKRPTASTRCHLRIEVQEVEGNKIAATLSLLVLEGVPDFAPGDWVRFSSRLYVPRGFANPGLPDARLLTRAQGIDLLATVRTPSDLHRVPGQANALGYARRWAFHLRQAMARAINQRSPSQRRGLCAPWWSANARTCRCEVEDGFRAAGATHVLSVSGLHLAVVVALVFHGLKRLIACFPFWSLRVPPKVLASALSLPACAFYTLLTGEAVATMRSALMASVVLGAAVVNRPVTLAAGIAAAAIVLLVSRPWPSSTSRSSSRSPRSSGLDSSLAGFYPMVPRQRQGVRIAHSLGCCARCRPVLPPAW
jgi:predicted membrane metal-binding protein